ncbi:hypothetical protein [Pseudomonas nitroreducens]|uniref:hypothetical protein n=1 Tax=Pseudomonas nitroreducens TaxID=46680 RepID=UPI003CC83201
MTPFEVGDFLPNTPHLFADLVELLAFVKLDGKSSIHKNDVISLRQAGVTGAEEVDEEEKETAQLGYGAAKIDRIESQLEDTWTNLKYRESAFKDDYPFVIQGDEIRLKEQLTSRQRVYRLLTCCSRLRSFKKSKGAAQRWAKAFTNTCQVSMKGLVPAHASVRVFDANSDDRQSYYGTDLRNALKILGKDLGVLSINESECNSASASGDGGLDLVSVATESDGATTSFALLGQCGAQETNWPSKTFEAHAFAMRNFYQIQFDYPTIMFTPVCYRNADGAWVSNKPSNGVYLADRLRILSLIKKHTHIYQITQSDWFKNFEKELKSFEIKT